MAKRTTTTDDAWITELIGSGAYDGIDVRLQLKRAGVWCTQNRRQLTRRFFINWLNRCDRPLQGGSGGSAGKYSGAF